ncbi:sensor histidine kinase [Nocardia sp. IBHARD005]|uniref:sensor histidine kinase n=1 Tax=Nocardia sp. IBHARD005 TaxID=3457765 RepID=UPI004057E068
MNRRRPPAEATHLRRLPWLVSVILTVITAVSLAGFATFALTSHNDADLGQVDTDLVRVTSGAVRLVGTGPSGEMPDDYRGEPDLDGVAIGYWGRGLTDLDEQCPQFAIVFEQSEGTRPFASDKHCTVDLTEPLLDRLRGAAAFARGPVFETVTQDGVTVRAAAQPVDDWRYERTGAVAVAWTDIGPVRESQRERALLIIGLTAALIVLVGVSAYVLTGQLLPSGVRALERQESVLAQTAHDLRAPIAALRALAETARDHPDQRGELLPRTVQLARRMGDIVDDLLSRARLAAGVEELEPEPLRLDQLAAGVIEELEPGTARITSTMAPSVVNGNPGLLRRAVRNVLDNAVRHGHLPGELAQVHVTVAGGRITVADEGPGLAESEVEDIFDEFRSGAGSTGLGLPIARWVAQAHGGSLTVHSADGGGAIFEFVLPAPARES